MKKLFLAFSLFVIAGIASCLSAQNYLITFAGTGESNAVNTVKIENLTSGKIMNLNGSDILHLSGTLGIPQLSEIHSPAVRIYPNPMQERATIGITPPVEGDAVITIYELTGKTIARVHGFLENTSQEYSISGLRNGLYMVHVTGDSYQLSGKLLCNGMGKGALKIEKVNRDEGLSPGKASKKEYNETADTHEMSYTVGDRLKFTGVSGNFSTILTDVPAGDETITFNFMTCTDGDNNNYPVTELGSQVWMAENLRTTKSRDETSVPLVTDPTTWKNLSTPAYCFYNNSIAMKPTYGALYNWFAVKTAKLCPSGWHMPSDQEWVTLISFLGGEGVAGGKLKETGYKHWTKPNTGASDEVGFTVLPSGARIGADGGFFNLYSYAMFWSSDESSPTQSINRVLVFDDSNFRIGYDNKTVGFSVRCLKGEEIVIPEILALVAESANPTFIEMTYNTDLENIVPDVSAFSVIVNSVPATVNTVAISGTKVWLSLANPIIYGDFVTVSYIKPSSNPLQTTLGVEAASFSPWVVTNNCISIPAITTASISDITASSALSGGTIISDGGSAVTARGVCWSTSPNPTIADSITSDGEGTGEFVSSLIGLLPDTTYNVRAYATNGVGTAYGNEESFRTLNADQVVDIDGNVYKTVTIGTQVWMAENLKTTKYNDNTDIPLIEDSGAWSALLTAGYCLYNNEVTNKNTNGALYNWFAVDNNPTTKVVSNGGRNVCPTDWHIPSDAEWTILLDFLTNNDYGYEGSGKDIAKSMAGKSGWNTFETPGAIGNDQASNNSSGFTALPGGFRVSDGTYINIGNYGNWWSSTEYSTTNAYYLFMGYFHSVASKSYNFDKLYGFSVRCLKDYDNSIPILNTNLVITITSNSASCGGNILSDGGADITARGVCWSTSTNPEITDSITMDGAGIGEFESLLTGLTPGTTYYVRAYATNSFGTAYGDEKSFTSLLSFQADIQPIFSANCIACHSGSVAPNLNLNTYQSLKNGGYINTDQPYQSRLYMQLESSSHTARTTSEQKMLILRWIEKGGLDN